MADTIAEPRRGLRMPTFGIAAMAVAGAAAAMLLAVAAGLPKLAQGGIDNDSLMRLVIVRDLIAGQGWFDPVQYRMGTEGGFAMHWSRLVDAPIALLVALAGEPAAAFAWPAMLLVAALALVLHLAAALGGIAARFPALVLAVTAFHFMGIFQPGSFDHHNLQLVLVLAMVAGLCSRTMLGGLAAGMAGAASLAVGVETLPLVAVGGAAAALPLVLDGRAGRAGAAGFGLGFATGGMLSLAATLPVSAWWRTACDAFSGGHAAVAVVAGAGLAMAALATGAKGRAARVGALLLVGAATAGVALLAVPACLGDPYAGLDPRLRAYWLDWVIEAQPLWSMVTHDPVQAATHYATPLVALAVLAFAGAGFASRRVALTIGLLLAVAVAVSWWQLRGAIFALALAVPPLAAWIAAARRSAETKGGVAALRLAAAWLLSFNVAWGLAVQGAAGFVTDTPRSAVADAAGEGSACLAAGDYSALTAEPPATVLAISNLGAPILAWTPHRALAGPYHRNQRGNLAVLDVLLGEPAEALATMRLHGATLLAFCPGNEETLVLAARAPEGLAALLLAGRVPSWLEPVSDGAALKLFRVAAAVGP